jgi:hypothetical protein
MIDIRLIKNDLPVDKERREMGSVGHVIVDLVDAPVRVSSLEFPLQAPIVPLLLS